MTVVFPFHADDQEQALKLALWIEELGGVKVHNCLMVSARTVKDPMLIKRELERAFKSVEIMIPHEDATGWPQGANAMFQCAARHVAYKLKVPWLWIEPDAVPLVPDWLDRIEAAYKACGKPFMGAKVNIPPAPLHMSGVAVYPPNVATYAPSAFRCRDGAWDVNAAKEILPHMAETRLIQHVWTVAGVAPSFPDDISWRNTASPEAVIFHRCKDLSALTWLRKEGDDAQALREAQEANRDKPGCSVEKAREILELQPTFKPLIAAAITARTAITFDVPQNNSDILPSPQVVQEVLDHIDEPPTPSQQIRQHCMILSDVIDGNPGRIALLRAELRKHHLLAPAKKRK